MISTGSGGRAALHRPGDDERSPLRMLALPEPVWRTRHRWVTTVLLVHLPLLVAWAAVRGTPLATGALVVVPAALWVLASAERLTRGQVRVPRALASSAAAAGLMACSSSLVAVSGGAPEAHLHAFVMVPVVALYEAWAPFATAAAWGLVERTVGTALWPHLLLGAAATAPAPAAAWRSTLVHTAFFAAACAGSAVAWSLARRARRTELDLVEQERLRALRDDVTGLGNRAALLEALDAELSAGGPLAVLALDVERFVDVNDTLGHDTGDELLRTVAARTAAALDGRGAVVRLGSDDFAAVLPGCTAEQALRVAGEVRTAVGGSVVLLGVEVGTDVRVGVSVRPRPVAPAAPAGHHGHHGHHPDDHHGEPLGEDAGEEVDGGGGGGAAVRAHVAGSLLREADVALRAARESPEGVALYDPATDRNTAARLTVLNDLRRALDADDQLVVHLQPQVSVATGALVGVEALARWEHPVRGLLPPSEFIDLATGPELSGRFTRCVLDAALAQCAAWLAQGREVPVSVNVTAHCLLRRSFVDALVEVLAGHGVPPRLLCLEVTEDVLVVEPSSAAAVLTALRDLGVRTSVDDFGTGYSSLSYLRSLPFDELKVDRSFVLGLFPSGPAGPVDDVVAAAVVDLGHRLGVHVVAEGVEHPHELEVLRRLGSDTVQGYLVSRPVPAEAFPAELLATAPLTGSQRALSTPPRHPVTPRDENTADRSAQDALRR